MRNFDIADLRNLLMKDWNPTRVVVVLVLSRGKEIVINSSHQHQRPRTMNSITSHSNQAEGARREQVFSTISVLEVPVHSPTERAANY
jgi:hypothetical protein